MKSEDFIERLKEFFPTYAEYPDKVDPQLGILRFYTSHSSLAINIYGNKEFDVYKDGQLVLINVPIKDVSSMIKFTDSIHINMENGSTIKVYI